MVIKFAAQTCRGCPARDQCTRSISPRVGRQLTVPPRGPPRPTHRPSHPGHPRRLADPLRRPSRPGPEVIPRSGPNRVDVAGAACITPSAGTATIGTACANRPANPGPRPAHH
ncbi:MAG: hypothetical protein ACRDRZ_02250 [Pseudonocardiaceae bacterium]